MAKEVIQSLVDGGKASAGPPLGPRLGPLGVNIKKIIDAINERTTDFAGAKVPVEITIDTGTKEFEIKVGTPPTSALIKKEIGLAKGAGTPQTPVGNITLDQLIKIARMKKDSMLAKTLKGAAKEVAGVCVSMGITIEGEMPKEFIKNVDSGGLDAKLK